MYMNTINIDLNLKAECLNLILKWIPPSTFKMSNSFLIDKERSSNPTGEFTVVLTQGYWLSIYPITQCQWYEIMNSAKSSLKNMNKPITNICWEECLEFCNRLNSNFISRPEGYIFSLPTEAQWENACKAGENYQYQIGNEIEDLSTVAWHRNNINIPAIQDVRQKKPNNWGFYDMLGNVEEWCFDYGLSYPDDETHNNWIGSTQVPSRTTRGGNILTNPPHAITCSLRNEAGTSIAHSLAGFRICLRSEVSTS